MHTLGKKQMTIELKQTVAAIPKVLSDWSLELSADGCQLTYTYDPHNPRTGITGLIDAIRDAGLSLKDVNTTQSTLEEIFVSLLKNKS
jgi:ABC-2 type transport system ATP-binding protein